MKSLHQKQSVLLRTRGYSIKEIAKRLKVSKGSVSRWVRGVALTKKQKETLASKGFTRLLIEKRRTTRIENENRKRAITMAAAGKSIRKISPQDLKLLGTVLYWAEGGKTVRGIVRVSNSDPAIIRIMMRFFREVCRVEERKFRASIHTHSKNNARVAEMFWSKITGIPQKSFYKTYVKKSKSTKHKRKSLPYGTVEVYICDTRLFLTIMGWIEKIKQILL